jgi:hypothetical protein
MLYEDRRPMPSGFPVAIEAGPRFQHFPPLCDVNDSGTRELLPFVIRKIDGGVSRWIAQPRHASAAIRHIVHLFTNSL